MKKIFQLSVLIIFTFVLIIPLNRTIADESRDTIIEGIKSDLQLISLSEEVYFLEFNTYSDDIEELGLDSSQWNEYWEISIEVDETGFLVTTTGNSYPVEGESLTRSLGE